MSATASGSRDYFLQRDVFAPRGLNLPDARDAYVALVGKPASEPLAFPKRRRRCFRRALQVVADAAHHHAADAVAFVERHLLGVAGAAGLSELSCAWTVPEEGMVATMAAPTMTATAMAKSIKVLLKPNVFWDTDCT